MNQEFVARNAPQVQYAFIQWLRNTYPNLYRRAMAESGLQMGDFSDTISKVFGTIKDTVAQLAPAYIQTRAELELLKINIRRARAGQMPVNTLEEAGAGTAVTRTGAAAGFGGIPQWAIFAGIGLIALLLLRR